MGASAARCGNPSQTRGRPLALLQHGRAQLRNLRVARGELLRDRCLLCLARTIAQRSHYRRAELPTWEGAGEVTETTAKEDGSLSEAPESPGRTCAKLSARSSCKRMSSLDLGKYVLIYLTGIETEEYGSVIKQS